VGAGKDHGADTAYRSARSHAASGSTAGRCGVCSSRRSRRVIAAPRGGVEARSSEPVTQRVLEEWSEIKAPRPAEILREHGYKGSVDLVKRRLREVRPPAERPAFRRRAGPAAGLGGAAYPPQDRWPRAASLRAGRLAALLGRAVGARLARADARVVSGGPRAPV
jgi:hypothetical protein